MEVMAVSHVHSNWSYDGSWTLESLVAKFSGRGVRVILMTEHDRGFDETRFQTFREACERASTEKTLLVPGIEYSDADNRIHVLVWGLSSFLGESLRTTEMLEAATGAGGLAVLAHPGRRRAWEIFDPRWTQLLTGIEAWNRKYDGWAPSKSAPALLRMGSPIPFVGLDFHTQRQMFPLEMALDLQSEASEQSVLECLRSGACSARAFGLPLDTGLVHGTLPALKMAEEARRTAASILKSTKVFGMRA